MSRIEGIREVVEQKKRSLDKFLLWVSSMSRSDEVSVAPPGGTEPVVFQYTLVQACDRRLRLAHLFVCLFSRASSGSNKRISVHGSWAQHAWIGYHVKIEDIGIHVQMIG